MSATIRDYYAADDTKNTYYVWPTYSPQLPHNFQ